MVMMTGKQNKKERKRRGVKTVGQVMRLVENEVRKRERKRESKAMSPFKVAAATAPTVDS